MLPFLRILGICLVIFASANCQGTVKVHWMDQTYNEWLDLVAGVKTSLVTRLNEYCTANDCKITSGGNNITANGVVFVGATDKLKYVIDGRFIICNIQVSTNEQSLTSEVLEAFMVNQRQNIVDDGKVAIAYVNKKLVYPPRDNLDNYLIISISSSIVLGLFILNIILTKKSNKKEERDYVGEQRPFIVKPPEFQVSVAESESTKITESSKSNKNHQSNKSLTRDESFDLKSDAKLSLGKNRKRSRSGSNGTVIAGNVGSGIGSTKNIAEDEKWYNFNNMSNSTSNEPMSRKSYQISSNSIKRTLTNEGPFNNKYINIPIDRTFDSDAADPKVAARLASTEFL